ncbi:DUF1697 domain-containing protein [Larkinella bovis]|uniref:DUF1697 domain-containing protein n=1 Tax=Larkinella bovis TaxID=683041 RepID=A0ABW0I868_9BACT
MKTYLAILRGINVSGRNKIAMNDLKSVFEALNGERVTTYIQSGNVVFKHTDVDPEQLARQIEQKIREKYGFDIPVLVRLPPELGQLVAQNPFLKEPDIELDKLHVTFLAATPDPANHDKIKGLAFGADRFILSGNAVYVYCPSGYGNTKLSNTFFENKLKVKATTRNWKTVNELVKLAESMR